MRRGLSAALLVALGFGLAACGRAGDDPTDAGAATTGAATTIDERLATITAAQVELTNTLQQRPDGSANVLAAITALDARLDALQRRVDTIAADMATVAVRNDDAIGDVAAALGDVRAAVGALGIGDMRDTVAAIAAAQPPPGMITAVAANLNSIGTTLVNLTDGLANVAGDVDAMNARVDAIADVQAEQAPLVAAAANGDPAVADLAAAFAAFQQQGGARLDPQQQQAIAAALAALNAQLAAAGLPTEGAPLAAAPANAAATQPAAATTPAPGAATPAPAGAVPPAVAPGGTAAVERTLVETAVGADLALAGDAFDLVTGTTYLWRISAGADAPQLRLLLPRLGEYAHVASVRVDGAVVAFPSVDEIDLVPGGTIEIEFTPIRPQVLDFEFRRRVADTLIGTPVTGTLTLR